jgi:hypothetical protein
MKQKWLRKALLEKPETRNHARPSPPFVPNIQDFDLQHIAGLRALYRHRPRKRVNQSTINALKLLHGHARMDLCATRVLALEVHNIPRTNRQARR